MRKIILIFTLSMLFVAGYGQSILDRKITVDINRQRLDDALNIVSNKGGFIFSYNSTIIKRDSLVTVSASNKSVRQVLTILLNNSYEFKESGNYVILRRVAIKLTTVTQKTVVTDNSTIISGFIINAETGERVPYASIYDAVHLQSTLSDAEGNFSLKLKNKYQTAAVHVSKYSFEDTSVVIEPKFNTMLVIAIVPVMDQPFISSNNVYETIDSSIIRKLNDSSNVQPAVADSQVEQTPLGNFLLSAKQKIQSLNLKQFFTEKPFQVGVIPGISNHGKLASQVVNNFSFNLIGGYNGGVNGIEMGGLFNIDKKNVRYLQVGGLLNIVGGDVTGLQLAGLHNNVLRNVHGFQLGGISNYIKGGLKGAMISGVYNHVAGRVDGFQLAGITNYSRQRVSGAQLAGFANFANRELKGMQVAGLFNYAKRMKGVQIGLINVSDTIDGYSIGLVNIVFKGYHKLTFSSNEIVDANFAFKTGSRYFYNILQVGTNVQRDKNGKIFTFGYGLGSEINLLRRASINPELTSQYLYLGDWDRLNLLNKLYLNLNIKIGKKIALFGGPSLNAYYSDQSLVITGYKSVIPPSGYHTVKLFNEHWKGWLGWNAGISLF